RPCVDFVWKGSWPKLLVEDGHQVAGSPSFSASRCIGDLSEKAQKSRRFLCTPRLLTALRRLFPTTRKYGRGLPSARSNALSHRWRRTRSATCFSIPQLARCTHLSASPSRIQQKMLLLHPNAQTFSSS